jgi:hypothetical protein
MERSKADSFSAYLEAKQQQKSRGLRSAMPATAGTPFTVLTVLAGAPQQSRALAELQPATGMTFVDFSQAIKRLQDLAFITVAGDPGHEIVQLTKLGADVAQLAR